MTGPRGPGRFTFARNLARQTFRSSRGRNQPTTRASHHTRGFHTISRGACGGGNERGTVLPAGDHGTSVRRRARSSGSRLRASRRGYRASGGRDSEGRTSRRAGREPDPRSAGAERPRGGRHCATRKASYLTRKGSCATRKASCATRKASCATRKTSCLTRSGSSARPRSSRRSAWPGAREGWWGFFTGQKYFARWGLRRYRLYARLRAS